MGYRVILYGLCRWGPLTNTDEARGTVMRRVGCCDNNSVRESGEGCESGGDEGGRDLGGGERGCGGVGCYLLSHLLC